MELLGKFVATSETELSDLESIVKAPKNLLVCGQNGNNERGIVCVTKSGHLVKFRGKKIERIVPVESDVKNIDVIHDESEQAESVLVQDSQGFLSVYKSLDKTYQKIWKSQDPVEEFEIDDFLSTGHEQTLVKLQGLGSQFEVKDFAGNKSKTYCSGSVSDSVACSLNIQKAKANKSVANVKNQISVLQTGLRIALQSLSGKKSVVEESKILSKIFGSDKILNFHESDTANDLFNKNIFGAQVEGFNMSGDKVVIYKITNMSQQCVKNMDLCVDVAGHCQRLVIKKVPCMSLEDLYNSVKIEKTLSQLFGSETVEEKSLDAKQSCQFLVRIESQEKDFNFGTIQSVLEFKLEEQSQSCAQVLPDVQLSDLKSLSLCEEITIRTLLSSKKHLKVVSHLQKDFDLDKMIANNFSVRMTENVLYNDDFICVCIPKQSEHFWSLTIFPENQAVLKEFVKKLYACLSDDVLITTADIPDGNLKTCDATDESMAHSRLSALLKEVYLLSSKTTRDKITRTMIETDETFLS